MFKKRALYVEMVPKRNTYQDVYENPEESTDVSIIIEKAGDIALKGAVSIIGAYFVMKTAHIFAIDLFTSSKRR